MDICLDPQDNMLCEQKRRSLRCAGGEKFVLGGNRTAVNQSVSRRYTYLAIPAIKQIKE
jgi:hypothetical protein